MPRNKPLSEHRNYQVLEAFRLIGFMILSALGPVRPESMKTNGMKITPFLFENDKLIRTIDRNGGPWFIAKDVCEALGLANSRDAIEKLDADEKGVASTDTLGGRQEMQIISESGLYALALRCRDAMTPGTVPHGFRKWVTADVLPSIRKTGGYSGGAEFDEAKFARIAAESARAVVEALLPGMIDGILAARGGCFKPSRQTWLPEHSPQGCG